MFVCMDGRGNAVCCSPNSPFQRTIRILPLVLNTMRVFIGPKGKARVAWQYTVCVVILQCKPCYLDTSVHYFNTNIKGTGSLSQHTTHTSGDRLIQFQWLCIKEGISNEKRDKAREDLDSDLTSKLVAFQLLLKTASSIPGAPNLWATVH